VDRADGGHFPCTLIISPGTVTFHLLEVNVKPRNKAANQSQGMQEGPHSGNHQEITLGEKAYRALRADIISGAIEAGQSLRLEYLKQRYGISFSPIREALNRLHSERFVLFNASRGFRLAPFSIAEMWDAIETRILIDCEALRRSLINANDQWEARLVGAFHALTLAANRNAVAFPDQAVGEQLEARHLEFHQGMLAACDSPWLISLSGQLYDQSERYRRPALRGHATCGCARDVPAEHQELMNAALKREAAHASALLAEHYRESGRFVEKMREESEGAARE
jgi:GntR family transcriptional regulator, carbon starvation induced regulator